MQADHFIQSLAPQLAQESPTELRWWQAAMPSGRRIYLLRRALGWTQSRVALELGISRRTVIRHEQGHTRRRWACLSLHHDLCQLEYAHAEQIIAYARLVQSALA